MPCSLCWCKSRMWGGFVYFFNPFSCTPSTKYALREDTHKKSGFLVVGPLKGGGGVTPPTTKQKTTFFSINGENSPGSCIMKTLFCEVWHFSPNFHKCTPNFVCVYFYWFENNIIFAKKKSNFFSPKILDFFLLSKSVLGYYKTKKKEKKKWHGPLNH